MHKETRRQPLYDQLVDTLTEKIEHEYRAGDCLPSERDLAETYGLSRTTVRLALRELESLGLVERQHGRGTFVADRSAHTTDLFEAYSFTEQMRSMGRAPQTSTLEFCKLTADQNLAEHMGLAAGDEVFKLKRLRSADDMPLMVETSYLPVRLFTGFDAAMLDHRSLYDVMETDYHQQVRIAEEEFFASIARRGDAEVLGIDEGSAVLDLVRTTYSMNNDVVEYGLSVARADQFRYRVVHRRGE